MCLNFRALPVFFFFFFRRKRSKKACCQKAPCRSLELRNSTEQLFEGSLATRLIADFCLSFHALQSNNSDFSTLVKTPAGATQAKKGVQPHSLPTMSRSALRGAGYGNLLR